ncbi:MAG TPA: DMT family transporter [Casimicrobiaceae bacterium]|nr:DMT family transporter [Casimicrobiaceae bacterium]
MTQTRAGAAQALRRALAQFVFAGLCLSSLDATAKYLVRDHSLLLVVWARYAGQMLVVTPFAWHRAGGRFWRTAKLRLQLLRSLFLLLATLGFWGGLRYLPLAEASSITFLAPMIVVALSWPILRERATRARRLASVTGFVGILLLLRPGSPVMHPAVLLLLGAALSNALYQILTRKLLDEGAHTTLFYSASIGTIGLSLLLPWGMGGSHFGAGPAAALVLLGGLAGLGHWFMTRAYLQAPAALLSPFTYLQILWATAFGYLVFGQHPDALSAVGMSVVIASGVALALWESRRVRLL